MRIDYATPTFHLYGPESFGWSYGDPFDYSTLEWNLSVDKPTQQELAEKSVEIYYNKEVFAYKETRQYPPVTEQLDQIYHEGVDAWKADIQAIKDANPKQEFDPDELERRKQEVRDFLAGS
jgi:hypothetical protein